MIDSDIELLLLFFFFSLVFELELVLGYPRIHIIPTSYHWPTISMHPYFTDPGQYNDVSKTPIDLQLMRLSIRNRPIERAMDQGGAVHLSRAFGFRSVGLSNSVDVGQMFLTLLGSSKIRAHGCATCCVT